MAGALQLMAINSSEVTDKEGVVGVIAIYVKKKKKKKLLNAQKTFWKSSYQQVCHPSPLNLVLISATEIIRLSFEPAEELLSP